MRVHRAWLKTHEKYKELKETLRKRETEGIPRSSRSTDRDRDRDRERRRDSDKPRVRDRDRQVVHKSMPATAEFADGVGHSTPWAGLQALVTQSTAWLWFNNVPRPSMHGQVSVLLQAPA